MNRPTKLILTAALIEMILVAAGALAWQAGLIGGAHAPGAYQPMIAIGFMPLALMFAMFRLSRRLASDTPRLSETHRRYNEQNMMLVTLIVAGIQGLSAYVLVQGEAIHNPTILRFIVVIFGLFFAVRGNLAAKLDPPTGPGAPLPSIWTRNLMRLGWCMALVGVMIVIGALVLPPGAVQVVLLVATLIILTSELAFRRAVRMWT